ncbi:MAG: hypothetical protein M0001_05975 [Treponema sp.]|nr:hypothetical protein [Treponema sp.]
MPDTGKTTTGEPAVKGSPAAKKSGSLGKEKRGVVRAAKKKDMGSHHVFYIAKVDSKKRIAVRGAAASYYAVTELEDGLILLKPQEEATRIEDIPPAVLAMMDRAMEGFKAGRVAGPIELD